MPGPGSGSRSRSAPVSRSWTRSSATACRRRSATSAGRVGARAVEHHDVLEHRLGVLGQQVAPARRPGLGGVDHRQPPAGGVEVGEHVAAGRGRAPPGAGDVPLHQRPPRRGARRRVHRSATQTSSRGAVPAAAVTTSHGRPSRRRRCSSSSGQPLAVHQHVGRGVGADPVQPHPAVEVVLAGGHLLGGQTTDVVEGLAAGQPGDRAVAGAADRAVDVVAGVDVEDRQRRLLVAADRQRVGERAPPRSGTKCRAWWCPRGRGRPGRRAPARCRRARARAGRGAAGRAAGG